MKERISDTPGDEDRLVIVESKFRGFTAWSLGGPSTSDHAISNVLDWIHIASAVSVFRSQPISPDFAYLYLGLAFGPVDEGCHP